jgi:hypothetical protein
MRIHQQLLGLVTALLVFGCATGPRIDWKTRIGAYSYDNALKELGPPDKVASTSDGSKVAEWLMYRGRIYETYAPIGGYRWRRYGPGFVEVSSAPSAFLRLTFGPDQKLEAFKEFYR